MKLIWGMVLMTLTADDSTGTGRWSESLFCCRAAETGAET